MSLFPPDAGLSPTLIIATSVMRLISIPLFLGRMYGRITPVWRVSWDGYFLTFAVLLDMVQWILLLMAAANGYGHRFMDTTPEQFSVYNKYVIISQPFYAWSLSFAKISVACSLLRIQRHLFTRKVFFYCMIILQLVIGCLMSYFSLSMCRPIEAGWDFNIPGRTCMDLQTIQTSMYVNYAMTIFTDTMFSLLPISLLMDGRRATHEQVAISSMIILGLMATCTTIYKTTMVNSFDMTERMYPNVIYISILTNLEMQLAIMACSVPCLKKPLERVLRRLHILKDKPVSEASISYHGGSPQRSQERGLQYFGATSEA